MRSILSIAALLVFALAMAAFAYSRSSDVGSSAATSCCRSESCPMKDASGKTVAGHENCDCCKGDGDSCPMMKKDTSGKSEHASSCPMMKKGDAESCPMMKKSDGAAIGMEHADHHEITGEGSCCCPCCNHENKEKTETAPTV